MNLLIDMDGVICSEEPTFERALAKPVPGARESLQALRDAGHQIIIYTARSWSELSMTKAWLETAGIPYDGIHMGKPVADRIVDDRAVPFTGWPAAMEALSKGGKPDIDLEYLRILRTATGSFLRRVADFPALSGPVLEVGPMTRTGLNSPVYDTYPESFVDTRAMVTERGMTYLSLDIDPDARPDICCDFMTAEAHIAADSIGSVIMMSCLEHMPQMFKVPSIVDRLLKPGGYGFFLTPWNLRFHGPRPDCWRISDDGYIALFGDAFEIVEVEKIPCPGRPLSPIGIQCIVRKKRHVRAPSLPSISMGKLAT